MYKDLEKLLEIEQKDTTIFDIIIYGSSVKGKENANDIDIVVIFLEGSLRERLEKLQKIKNNLKNLKLNLDIKQILLKELFSAEFFARTGIFIEGISIFKKKKFCETLGFNAFALFWYSLTELNHTQKVKFNYILAGRSSKGIIENLNGERLANGAIKIPIEHSLKFEEILKSNKVSYNKKNILQEN